MVKCINWQVDYENMGELGEGGNAKVYHVKCKADNREYALKDLVAGGNEKKCRFIDEINVIKDNYMEVKGIIPIVEYSLEEYWYTMPIAKSAINYLDDSEIDIDKTIEHVIELCETLENLHKKGISHRDIKPSNIYFYDNRFYFGDFGLVEFPENTNDFTRSDKGLGAIFTIAPEMKRNPKDADGKKADIFSLAKTLWMFLTRDEKGFDGVYNYFDTNHSLRCMDKYKNTHLVELDELLKDATDNSPDVRPTIIEFKERLINWIDIYSDEDKSQASDWNFLNKQLFGSNPPESSSWRNNFKIVEVLNIVGRTPAYNHMLFSSTGGLDFSHSEIAVEDKCIKLYDTHGFCHIVKPKILYFEGFEVNFKWNYFLLELDELLPVLDCDPCFDFEYLVEDFPANYVSAQFAQYGVYDYETGTRLPDGYQTVHRYTKGKFLIVMKRGPYNGISGTYDGRHGDCKSDQFREYIDSLSKRYVSVYNHAKQDGSLKLLSDEEIEDRILYLDEFNENPFKKKNQKSNNHIEIRERYMSQQKSKDYISHTYANWDFSDILHNYAVADSTTIKFVFKFSHQNSGFSLESLSGVNNYLCNDGKLRRLDSHMDEQCYCVYDREIAIDMKNKLEKELSEILIENNLLILDDYETCFAIKIVKVGKPSHLFTKKEIEEAIRNADDRFSNRLVIDENGYAKVIKKEEIGHLFPVRHVSWDGGNVYVGKYSTLSTLEDDYISSLQGWLRYLKTGRKQYMDYVNENIDEEKLLKEIKEYY